MVYMPTTKWQSRDTNLRNLFFTIHPLLQKKRHPISYTLLEKMSYSIQPVPSTTTATKKVPPSAALGAPPKEESPEMKPNISDFIPCSQPDTRKMPSASKLEELP